MSQDDVLTIRCKIERKGGSVVTLDRKKYHFKPRDEEGIGPHLCDVADQGHLARLLSITEGYELHRERIVVNEPVSDEPAPAVDPQAIAHEVTGMTVSTEAANGDPVASASVLDKVLANPEDATDEELADAFEEQNGRRPNERAKRETIIKRILENAAAAE